MFHMSLDKTYQPEKYEADIYALWEQSGAFKPKGEGSKHFSMVAPPPNANGNLHLGHALTNAIYDVAIRYHRMLGDNTLYLPGADHAGFETQVVFEKQLAKEGKSRFDFSRDDLYEHIYRFVDGNRHNFESQFRKLGASCDWNRYTFTLDQKIIDRAYKTFKQLWDDGLVYRGERLVNFCTFHGTAFADIEVAYEEARTNLWHIRYPLVDGSGEVVVATTRPETMLGDTGVAVHPDDTRYGKLVGKTVRLPLTGREVPIVADEFVEIGFGTGAVKLTPAHDQNDYDAAERHNLPKISVINHEGRMINVPDEFRGKTVLEARMAVVGALEAGDCLKKTEELIHNVGHCYKCGTVIEPLLRDQWFVDMQPLAKKAIAALQEDQVVFYPESKRDQLVAYLENLRDWNISRQIAWGIPIPAFRNVDEPDSWIFDTRVDQETIEVDGKTYHRDPDVFDTWFSSSSWPYATLEYPGPDYEQFYPTSLLDTGGEILYPWVSRMLMLGLYVTGEVPFRSVYIHGYVMAEDGSKMSKSVGNVIDPIPVLERYGSDALRMGLLAGRSPAVNRGYDSRRVEEARNFCNKLWNIARYIEASVSIESIFTNEGITPETTADTWILHKLNEAIKKISTNLDPYRFSEAYDSLYHFIWNDVADWYIEASKGQESRAVLGYVLRQILALAHPFAPFATEAIWQELQATTDGENSLLITEKWPKTTKVDQKAARTFEEIKTIVIETRAIIKALRLRNATLFFKDSELLLQSAPLIAQLANLKEVTEVSSGSGLNLTTTTQHCWLDVDRASASAYLDDLQSQRAQHEKMIAQYVTRLGNEAYVNSAPKHIVDDTRQKLEESREALARIEHETARFSQF